MAFLHWQTVLAKIRPQRRDENNTREAFYRALCIGQTLQHYDYDWTNVCYHVFSSLLRERLPAIPLDRELAAYADIEIGLNPQSRSTILRDICGKRIMGRCLCVTENGLIGVGPGLMATGDVIVIPLGCYTPVILRPERREEYRFVGDIYVDGYMLGDAVYEYNKGRRQLLDYVIH